MFFGNILGGIGKTIGNFFTPAKKFIRTGPVFPLWRRHILEEGAFTPLSHLENKRRELMSRRDELKKKVDHLERKVYDLKHRISPAYHRQYHQPSLRAISSAASSAVSTSFGIRSESESKSSFMIPLLVVVGGIVIFMMLRR